MISSESYSSMLEENILYKVHMGIKPTTCLQASTENESRKWYSRLGHINCDSLKAMMQKELIIRLKIK